MKDCITIKGARENNLKNIDLTVPRDKLIVFTGLSGSGKSSLAFETIFAEGQRRYIETFSALSGERDLAKRGRILDRWRDLRMLHLPSRY